MKNYLVTGGAGFIGSNLTNQLLKDNKVTVIDDLSMGYENNLDSNTNLTFIEGSITDNDLMEKILKENKFDYIYHLAAIASVADSIEHPIETSEVNFQAVLNLLELIKEYQKDLKRLIFASSAAVYGQEKSLPKYETSPISPISPYAIDKFSAERYVVAYNDLYNVPTSAVRFFNVYGPKQNPASPYSGVISILLDRINKTLDGEDTEFTVFGDGEQTRDFVYVKDVISALLLIPETESTRGEVFNVATGNTTSLNNLIKSLTTIADVDLKVVYKDERSGDIKDSLANIDKLKELGYSPKYNVDSGLKEYFDYEMSSK